MLTGDKLETAKCIGVCTGFKSEYQSFFEIVSMDPAVIEDRLEDFDPTNHCLVITGSCLDIILNDKTLMSSFLQNAKSAKSVILCRCAPKQKAQVAKAVKKKYGKVVCCIGDGGNDVGMIQQANIGVGLQGKEGMQAALASDVSLVRFKDLEMLFLWHGRLSYLRTSKLSNFVVHRGLLITTIQALFVIIFYYVSINIYNGYLIMGFNTIFTNLPVFALILDQDIPLRQALNYPILYDHVQDGKQMNLRVFLTWTWKSIFQGALILLLSILLLSKTFLEMVTITFTAIIFIGNLQPCFILLYIFIHTHSSSLFSNPLTPEFLNIISMIRTWHRYITISIVVSVLFYLVCLFFLRDFFLLCVLSVQDFLLICLLSIIAWLPFQAYQTIQRTFFPSKIDIVINEAKMQDRRARKKKSNLPHTPEKLF